jgi:hypothetical protein
MFVLITLASRYFPQNRGRKCLQHGKSVEAVPLARDISSGLFESVLRLEANGCARASEVDGLGGGFESRAREEFVEAPAIDTGPVFAEMLRPHCRQRHEGHC